MQLDGGASINIISYDLAVHLVGTQGINTAGQQVRVKAVGGHVLTTMGTVMLELELNGRTTTITDRVEMHMAKISTVFLVLKRCSVPLLMGSVSMSYFGIQSQAGSGVTTWGNSKWKSRLAIPTIPYELMTNAWVDASKVPYDTCQVSSVLQLFGDTFYYTDNSTGTENDDTLSRCAPGSSQDSSDNSDSDDSINTGHSDTSSNRITSDLPIHPLVRRRLDRHDPAKRLSATLMASAKNWKMTT